jgi:hypothetical protein
MILDAKLLRSLTILFNTLFNTNSGVEGHTSRVNGQDLTTVRG